MKIILSIVLFSIALYAQNISTYFYSDILSKSIVKEKLNSNGFEIIGEYSPMENKDYTLIVFTSNTLKSVASKDNRSFAGVLKILIDKKTNRLVINNPEYFLRAFLQDDFNQNRIIKTTLSLKNIFDTTNSKYSIEEDDLEDYHFMFGMPYYEDTIEVATGDNLNHKIQINAKNKIVFSLKLNNGATLYGISMDSKLGEKYYLNAISQEKHAVLLPYMVVVKNKKAYILHPKYYLAISLPNLTMGEFMTISDIPGEIEDYFINLFK